MLYIPGEGFITECGGLPSFNGTALTVDDVIVATINYRLGPLGFMRYTGNGSDIAGNFGIKDQIAAMQWVHDNISAFGGDPARPAVLPCGSDWICGDPRSVRAALRRFKFRGVVACLVGKLLCYQRRVSTSTLNPYRSRLWGSGFVGSNCVPETTGVPASRRFASTV